MLFVEAIEKLKEFQAEQAYHRAIRALCMWDQWMGLPQEGAPFRNQLQAYLAGKNTEIYASPRARDLAVYFKNIPLEEIQDPLERAMVRTYLYQYR